jgi:hypothetical protein
MDSQTKNENQPSGTLPDVTPRSIGGDDSIENASPMDSRLDEKVIVNKTGNNRTENLQTDFNKNEAKDNDGENTRLAQ